MTKVETPGAPTPAEVKKFDDGRLAVRCECFESKACG